MKQKLFLWGFVLVVLTFVIIQTGRYTFDKSYSTTSFTKLGTSAFIDLIRQSGYKVKEVGEMDTNLGGNTSGVLIAPPGAEDETREFAEELKSGKKLAVFWITKGKQGSAPKPVWITTQEKKPGLKVVPVVNTSLQWQDYILSDCEPSTAYTTEDGYFTYVITNKGRTFHVATDAAGITNEFIDQANNASVFMGVISSIAKPGSEITVVTRLVDQGKAPGLVEKLGKFVHGTWNQLLFLVLILFLTWCIRFGFPPESRANQRSSLEMVDGFANLARKKVGSSWALRAVFDRILTSLERRHRVSREQLLKKPRTYLGEDAEILINLQDQLDDNLSINDAVKVTQDLKRLV